MGDGIDEKEAKEKAEKFCPLSKDSESSLEAREAYRKRLLIPWRHTENVRKAAEILFNRLIDHGHRDLARRLAQRAARHDNSKFEGIEWEYLTTGDHKNKGLAITQHQQSNSHHPEFFINGILGMNDVEIAEMVCDWHARSSEIGTDL